MPYSIATALPDNMLFFVVLTPGCLTVQSLGNACAQPVPMNPMSKLNLLHALITPKQTKQEKTSEGNPYFGGSYSYDLVAEDVLTIVILLYSDSRTL